VNEKTRKLSFYDLDDVEKKALRPLRQFLKEKYDNEIKSLKSQISNLQKKVDGIKFKVIYGKKSKKKKGVVEYECPVCGHKWEDDRGIL